MDDLRIDSHKLIYHVGRVHEWLDGKMISPLYMEVAPSGGCNHRCIFCALDYIGYQPHFLDTKVLKSMLSHAARLGVKSLMYAGEGEPLLHKDIASIVRTTKQKGIDVAITSNGVLLRKELANDLLKHLSWFRVSFNAGTALNYARIHRTSRDDFHKVISNLREAVQIKRKQKLDVVIGVQFLLIPENAKEVLRAARLLKSIGVDYLTIKPYSQHPLSGSHIQKKFNYRQQLYLEKKLETIASKSFKIVFRGATMKRLDEARGYRKCLGLPFWAYVDACGNVCACSAFLGKKNFCYGNIYQKSFSAIMKGKERKKTLATITANLDTRKCREVCRLDKINSYLWELKHPGPHTNFI